ncbi:MAG: hypothetical protein QNJ12_19035 [Ilumatobacter sp.]|uniref:hypothetical protein n=1 Tax=Ilumatobacter sp. TaxID=1967498 RepID=UPI0026256AC9|nr:hypothetical protein [Ilumatobacter sp.]MDJ0770896.1 hypothetical protein [Ilumatobacter sp.]
MTRVAVAAALLLVVGCGSDADEYTIDGPLIVEPRCADFGDGCEFEDGMAVGPLRLVERCSFIEGEDGDLTLLIWPVGTEWAGDSIRVGDQRLRDGDMIDVGGGGGEKSKLRFTYPDAEILDEVGRCLAIGGGDLWHVTSAEVANPRPEVED